MHTPVKQIDVIKTYAQKRCLVVDELPESRAEVKRILKDFGAKQTDTAGNAQESIDACEKVNYDLIIAEFELGQGKNGQQLLEDLKLNNLIKESTLFIMFTGENASEYVLHALEHEPDDYLQKPINRESLRTRLDQAVLKNEYLLKIKHWIDEEKIEKAIIEACKLVQTRSRYQNDVRKLLAELYLKNNQADEAEAVYALFTSDSPPLWAELGTAHAYFKRKEFSKAEILLKQIIENTPKCVAARDLLAKVFEETHRPNQAQRVLLEAIQLSPRSSIRQRHLGRVSLNVEDPNSAVHAFRASTRHAKNTRHETPDDLINLAESLIQLAKKTNSDTEKEQNLIDEATGHLQYANKRFGRHPIVKMRSTLVAAELASEQGNETNSSELIKNALKLHTEMRYSVIANTSTQLCIDCAKSFMNCGQYDEGEAILQELARLNTDQDFATKIDKLLREPLTKEGRAFAAKRNKEGIEYYEKEDIDAAVRSFKSVLLELPNHIGLNLNLIQSLISKSKNEDLSHLELETIHSCFQRIGKINSESSYLKRYTYLEKRFYKLNNERDNSE